MKRILYNLLIINILTLFSCTKDDQQTAEKLVFLNNTLEHQLESIRNKSEYLLMDLKKMVEKEGNTMEGRERIKRAEELKKTTAILIHEIDKLKNKIITKIGQGLDEKSHGVVNIFGKSGIYNLFVAENGLGVDLQNKLNAYRDFILKEYSDIGFFAQNTPSLTENNPDYYKKYFGNTIVIEALALLTERQHQAIQLEIKVLQKLINTDFRDEGFNVKEYLPVVILENDSLNVGDLLQAQVYIGEKLGRAGMKMMVNGQTIPNENGIGKVKFIAQGKGWQTWQGSVTFNHRGRDTTLSVVQRYYVMEKQ